MTSKPLRKRKFLPLGVNELAELLQENPDELWLWMDTMPQIVNTASASGRTLLHEVSALGWTRATEELLKRNALVDLQQKTGSTALHLACECSHEYDGPHSREEPGTARAAEDGERSSEGLEIPGDTVCRHAKVAKLLIDYGANIYQTNELGMTPFHVVALNGCKHVLKVLLESNAEKGRFDFPATAHSLFPLAPPPTSPPPPSSLLAAIAAPASFAPTPSLENAGRDLRDFLPDTFLSEKQAFLANVPFKSLYKSRSPLVLAASRGDVEMMGMLLDAGAHHSEVQVFDRTPLMFAVVLGQVQACELLLQRGVNPNHCDRDGSTSLHYVAGELNEEILALLLSHGANINIQNRSGKTPLHNAAFACTDESLDFLERMLRADPHLNAADSNLITPLMEAVCSNPSKLGVIRLLIDHGCAVNARSASGLTALHYAVRERWTAAVELLVSSGADVHRRDNNGREPIPNVGCVDDELSDEAPECTMEYSTLIMPLSVLATRAVKEYFTLESLRLLPLPPPVCELLKLE